MSIELKRVTIDDIDEIIKMQKESFKLLLDRYHDGDLNPYNDSLEKVKYKIENYYYYFILIDDEKVGAIAINDKKMGLKRKLHQYTYCQDFKIKNMHNLLLRK